VADTFLNNIRASRGFSATAEFLVSYYSSRTTSVCLLCGVNIVDPTALLPVMTSDLCSWALQLTYTLTNVSADGFSLLLCKDEYR